MAVGYLGQFFVGAPVKEKQYAAQINPFLPAGAVLTIVLVAVLGSYAWPAKPGASMPWMLNPTGLVDDWKLHIFLCFWHNVANKEAGDILVGGLSRWLSGGRSFEDGADKLPQKLEVLEGIDIFFLNLNHVVEYFMVHHLINAFLTCGMDWRLSELSIMNGPVAYILAIVLNDFLYYTFHHTSHRRMLYPYCHKQHHRNFVPWRGVTDATNLHPIEQIAGMTVFITSLKTVTYFVGMHEAAGACISLSWAFMNVANHITLDSQLHLPVPFPAYPQDHQMHHRFPMCNYSKLSCVFDRVFGTYREYRPLGKNGVVPKALNRPVGVPSWQAVATLAVCLLSFTLGLEVVHARQLPAFSGYAALVGPGAILALVALGCAACETRKVAGDTKAE